MDGKVETFKARLVVKGYTVRFFCFFYINVWLKQPNLQVHGSQVI